MADAAATPERKKLPLNNPEYVNELLDVAKTWFDARYLNKEPIFVYGHTTALDDDFFAMKVRNQIDCSAYVGMVLRGIRFEDSPYAHLVPTSPAARQDLMGKALIADIKEKTKVNKKYTWAFDPAKFTCRIKVAVEKEFPVRFASQLGEMFVDMGRSLDFKPDFSDVEPGDIIFYAKLTNGQFRMPNRYRKISHVSIVADKKPASVDPEVVAKGYPFKHMMYEVSSHEGVVIKRCLEKVSPDTICIVARPNLLGSTVTQNSMESSGWLKNSMGFLKKVF